MSELDLQAVLETLRRAKDELTHAITPLWPGVKKAVLYTNETKYALFDLKCNNCGHYGYYVCEFDIEGLTMLPLEEASEQQVVKYLERLSPVTVDLANEKFAFLRRAQDRLLGMYEPMPIFFAEGHAEAGEVLAKYDGVNLFFERGGQENLDSFTPEIELPLFGLLNDFASNKTLSFDGLDAGDGDENFSTDDMLDTKELAEKLNHDLYTDHENTLMLHRLRAISKSLGGDLHCYKDTGKTINIEVMSPRFQTKKMELSSPFSPITSSVCLHIKDKTNSTELINFMRQSLTKCVKQL